MMQESQKLASSVNVGTVVKCDKWPIDISIILNILILSYVSLYSGRVYGKLNLTANTNFPR